MFSLSLRRFHSLLIGPALLPFLFSTSPNAARNDAPSATDSSYTVHSILFGSFPFSDQFRLVSNGSVSHGTLRTFGIFNGYSQDSFIYEPNYGYVGADSFTYHACDSSNNCVDGTINLNVANNPPHAVADGYAVHGNLYLSGPDALRKNDSDPDDDSFSVVSFTQASHGTFTYSYSYGAAVYQPNYAFTGTDSISYQICDNLGLCDSATATFNVVNDPPKASPDEYSTDVNQTLFVGGPDALVANDSDPEHDYFSVTSYTQTAHGTAYYSYSYG